MKAIVELLLRMIRSAIDGTRIASPLSLTEEEEKLLYSLAKKHDMAHLVSYALDQNGINLTSREAAEKFRKQQMMAIFRYENQNYDLEQVRALLEREGIRFLPLKGAVIRSMYPEPWMRTGCDIDILVDEENLVKTREALKTHLGYSFDGVGDHDLTLVSPGGVHFELHFCLLDNRNEDKYLKNVWRYARPKAPDSSEYILSDEMFYYYHIQHMAKHFVKGGCGVKPFLDLWVFRRSGLSLGQMDREYLEKGGFERFAEQSEALAEVWFGEAEHTELTRGMQTYVLRGGVYGNAENKEAADKDRKASRLHYVLSRIWLPFSAMSVRYPALEQRRWLLPFYQVKRWFCILFSRKAPKPEREENHSNEQVDRLVGYLMDSLEL